MMANKEVKRLDPIRIMLVEDDEEWLKALTAFLDNEIDFRVVAAVPNREKALEILDDSSIGLDVILMDINLTGNNYDGIYLAAEVSQIRKVKIIMVTSLQEERLIIDSFTAGAVHYVHKTRFHEIPAAIRSVARDTTPFEVLLEEFSKLKRAELLKNLSPSEREIFGMIESGMTQRQIGESLFKSSSTLKTQVKSILKKLGVKSSKEAIRKVRMKGIMGETKECD
jgi:NarL family two-component system response regulator LiaR